MSDEIPVGDLTYVSSKRASEITGYAQDYIGQLARSGQIEAKRVGGLWYVYVDSLNTYMTGGAKTNTRPSFSSQNRDERDLDVIVAFDGKDYISANRASKLTGYNQDYVGQLARSGKILSKQVGNRWYVDRDGILAHKSEKDSLLAAVQADSVGIYRPPIEEKVIRDEEKSEIIDIPLLTYVPDSGALQPQISKRSSDMTNSHVTPEFQVDTTDYTNPTPINIVRRSGIIEAKVSPNRNRNPVRDVRHTKKERKLPVLLGGTILVAVLILTIGIVSVIKSQSTFSLATATNMTASALAANGDSVLGRILGVFENFVVPELTYLRKK